MDEVPTFYAAYVAGALLGGMLLGFELGFRLGRRRELGDRTHSALGVVQGALLGTLALLLGFTFSLASERYETRRILLVQETNAIASTYLRTTLAPEESGRAMRRALRDYLTQRLVMLREGGDAAQAEAASRRVQELQIDLWRMVRAEAVRAPESQMLALLVQSLNEAMDFEELQRAERAVRVPHLAVSLVVVAALLAAVSLGYGFGVAKQRALVGGAAFAVLVCCTTFTILDFDRPDGGFIQASDAMVASLRERVIEAVDREGGGR